MKRRQFISLVGGAVAWPLVVRAQQSKIPTIGVLVLGNPDPAFFLKTFREGLKQIGYVEGQDVRLEFRSARGQASHLPELAAELVRLKVDIIVAWQTTPVTAAKQATVEIPIVMCGAGDPVRTGLIASLSRPGGNITGIAGLGPEVAAKNIELIRDMLPSARRVTVLGNAIDPFTQPYLAQIELAAQAVGIEIQSIMRRPGEEFDDIAFADILTKQADAVIIQPSLLRKAAVDLALKHRLPIISNIRQLPEAGGLASYGIDQFDQYRRAATYVDRILKGAKPADLPVEQPTRFEMVINLKTAKALGLTIPPSLLARADEVIE